MRKQYLNGRDMIRIVNIETAAIIVVLLFGLLFLVKFKYDAYSNYSDLYEGSSEEGNYNLVIQKKGFPHTFGKTDLKVKLEHYETEKTQDGMEAETSIYHTIFYTQIDGNRDGIKYDVKWLDDGVAVNLYGKKEKKCFVLPYEKAEEEN